MSRIPRHSWIEQTNITKPSDGVGQASLTNWPCHVNRINTRYISSHEVVLCFMSCLPKISCILYVTAKLLFIHYFMPTWCHHTVCRTFYLTWAAAGKSTPPTTVLALSSLNVSTTKTASSFSWFNWLLRKNIRQTSDIFYRMHWDIYRCNSTILLLKKTSVIALVHTPEQLPFEIV